MRPAAEHLEGGRFYGPIATQRRIDGAVLTEVRHVSPRALPRHAHERTYVSLLLEGSYREEVGGRAVHHRLLDVSLRPAGTEHRDEVGREGGRLFLVEVASSALQHVQGGRDDLSHPFEPREVEALGAALRLYRELRRWDRCSPGVAAGLLAELVAAAGRPARDAGRPPWLGRLVELLNDRLAENVPLDDLAREAGVHPGHVSRTFRRFVGLSPGELTRALRVRRVLEGLPDRERSLSRLAYDCGFADQAHMTRVVTRVIGMPPGRLRALVAAPDRRHGRSGGCGRSSP